MDRGDAGSCHSLLSAAGYRRSAFRTLARQKSHQRPFTFSLWLTPQTPSHVKGRRERQQFLVSLPITTNPWCSELKGIPQNSKYSFPTASIITQPNLFQVRYHRAGEPQWNTDTQEYDSESWPRGAFGPQREATHNSWSPQYNSKLPLTGQTGGDLRWKRPRLQMGKCRASEKRSSVNTGRKCAQPEQGFQNQADIAVFLLVSTPLFSYKIKGQGRLNKNLCFLTPGQDFSKSTS